MSIVISPDQILSTVLIDARLQKAIRAEVRAKADAYFEACRVGSEHPLAMEVIDFVEDMLFNCSRTIARYLAKNGGNEFPVYVFGFDALCWVFAPEFDRGGPFLSHEEAMASAASNFGEYGLGKPKIYVKQPPLCVSASPRRPDLAAATSGIVQYRIGDYKYSRLDDGRYKRHKSKFFDGDEILDASQLVARLSSTHGCTAALLAELAATGWHDITEATAASILQNEVEREAAEEAQRVQRVKEVVTYIDDYLAGRTDTDGKLVDEAAHKWARGEYASARGARDRYYFALHTYNRAKGKA